MMLRTQFQSATSAPGYLLQDLDVGPAQTDQRLSRMVILGSSEAALALARDAYEHGLSPVVYDLHDGPAMRSRVVLAQRASAASCQGDRDALVRELRELGDPRHACLVATDDAWLRRLVMVRAKVRMAYRSILNPDDDAIEICLDRVRFAQWCRAEQIPTVKSWCVGLEDRPVGLRGPFLLRPALGVPSTWRDRLPEVVLASDEVELLRWLPRFEAAECPVLVSQALTDHTLRSYIVGFARTPQRFLGCVAERVRPARQPCAQGTYLQSVREREALDLAEMVAQRLDYVGLGEVEIAHDWATGRYHVMQVNARPWPQYAMAPASGHDLLRTLTSIRASGPPRLRASEVNWWSPMADLQQHLCNREPGLLAWGRIALHMLLTLARANVYARLDWFDPLPALPRMSVSAPDQGQVPTMSR